MSTTEPDAAHVFLAATWQHTRRQLLADLKLPLRLVPVVSSHRRLRGPYTAAGTILRALIPDAVEAHPDLVARHEVEILTVAPELKSLVRVPLETLTSLAIPAERTRFYSRLRTVRISHGLTELLRDLVTARGGRWSLVIDDLHEADHTDQEFVAVLLRRMDPRLLTVVAAGRPALLEPPPPLDPPAEPDTVEPEPLHTALSRFCRTVRQDNDVPAPLTGNAMELATRFVRGDCTADEPELVAAYEKTPPERRRELHDDRAAELTAMNGSSWSWGALPYHLEHGGDPLGRGADSLLTAIAETMNLGFYHATLELCLRGRDLVPSNENPDLWWKFTMKLPTSLAALGRVEAAESVCDEVRAGVLDPDAHMRIAYATAMLYTRQRASSRRDHERALGWINEAIVIAALLPDRRNRAFDSVFQDNGRALVEVHRGRSDEALRLVNDGIARMDEAYGPDEHRLHRSVLLHNRAQVLAGLGRLPEALNDYRTVSAADPHYPEYHFDLGGVLHRLGRDDEAIEEYETAMRLGPPFPELYYNRGDVRLGQGDVDGALADFGYVLELDPRFVAAYVNRAGLFADMGELDAADRDVTAGLELEPENPYLHALRGQIHAERDEFDAAMAAFDLALGLDPELVVALSGRATVAQRIGQRERALADLWQAVELAPDDAALRYNHAFVLREAGQWNAALAELDIAAKLAPDDPDIAGARAECLAGKPA